MVGQVSCIRYRNWNRTRNCGDALTPFIAEMITGLPLRYGAWNVPHLIGVGSILGLANGYSHVWGSGYLNPTVVHPGVHDCTFHALRGQKTVDLLRSMGVSVPELPLGDPGIFVGDSWRLFRLSSACDFRAAIVPHHNSVDHPLFKSALDNSDFTVVNILDDTMRPIELIARSEIVISQSLHGLVFAESLGKPSLWISDCDDPIWRFKFDDWFSTTAEPQIDPQPMTSGIRELLGAARVCGSKIDKRALAAAFPLDQTSAASAPFIDFTACRRAFPTLAKAETLFGTRVYPEEELNSEILLDITEKIMPIVYRIFDNFSERLYCAVVPSDEALYISDDILREVCMYAARQST